MKTIAVITNDYRTFNTHKLENQYSGNNQNFIQISSLNEVKDHKFNDYVNKSNSVKMPNIDEIVKEVIKNIDNK